MNDRTTYPVCPPGVVSLHHLLHHRPSPKPALIEPGLLPYQGILFVGGEPKIGKSLLVTNLAFDLAAGASRTGFPVSSVARVLVCQFELPTEQFAARLTTMREAVHEDAADHQLLIVTNSSGHLLSTHKGLEYFIHLARAVQAQVIVLDPLYAAHDQDENDTRAMAALCQNLLHLRDASRASLIVVHHVRKSVKGHEIGSAFRGSSALHAVGDTYMLLRRPSATHLSELEVRFQFRYAAPQPPRRLCLNPRTLWFSPSQRPLTQTLPRRKVENIDVQTCLLDAGRSRRFNQLRDDLMQRCGCSKRTAQLAIQRALDQRAIAQEKGHYRLPH